jgi:hypothetical protein
MYQTSAVMWITFHMGSKVRDVGRPPIAPRPSGTWWSNDASAGRYPHSTKAAGVGRWADTHDEMHVIHHERHRVLQRRPLHVACRHQRPQDLQPFLQLLVHVVPVVFRLLLRQLQLHLERVRGEPSFPFAAQPPPSQTLDRMHAPLGWVHKAGRDREVALIRRAAEALLSQPCLVFQWCGQHALQQARRALSPMLPPS